jgi:ElaB/YqjD/DUF883 family membrane-anchored ribosome-binding protein
MNAHQAHQSAEDLLKSAARNVSDLAQLATHQVEESISKTREKLMEMQGQLAEKTRTCARETDQYVHQHPWNSIAIALGLGFLAGLLLRKD